MKTPNVKPNSASDAAIILFGLSSEGKPQAGKFVLADVELVTKAAQTLGYSVMKVDDEKTDELAKQLKPGRPHATGRDLIPHVPKKLFEAVVQIAIEHGFVGNEQTDAVSDVTLNKTKSKKADGYRLPTSWDDLKKDDLVIAQHKGSDTGWLQAFVLKREGNNCTLKWRYPDLADAPPPKRHIFNLGLLYPGKPTGAERGADASTAPGTMTWHNIEIAPGLLVLIKDDSPAETVWPAIVIACDGDSIKLRWSESPNLPEVVRPRHEIALLHPAPAKTPSQKRK
jgi:hypothetical protein